MKYRYLVVDDEALARKLVMSNASKIELLEFVDECSRAVDALSIMRRTNIDLIFLDIQMPEISGLNFVKGLRKTPAIIFTTAHRDYAVEAFELNVIDYLLKPISFERFLKAIDKFLDTQGKETQGREASPATSMKSIIYIRSNRKTFPILLDEIKYIESLGDYVKVHLKDKVLITNENITSIMDKLPETDFLRIHRSFIVALKQVAYFTSEYIRIGDKELPFGRVYKQLAQNRLSALTMTTSSTNNKV